MRAIVAPLLSIRSAYFNSPLYILRQAPIPFSLARFYSDAPHPSLLGDEQKIMLRKFTSRMLASNNFLAPGSYAKLSARSIVQVKGPDAEEFLQGLTTNQMSNINAGGSGLYQAFLYPNGRVMMDAFIYPKNIGTGFPEPDYLIEIDSQQKTTLLTFLSIHKLRAKIEIQDVTQQYDTYAIWGSSLAGAQSDNSNSIQKIVLANQNKDSARIWTLDKRTPDTGLRLILEKEKQVSLPPGYTETAHSDYVIYRMLMGVPEGPSDFIPRVSLPLELNLDIMAGVDFTKGCYVGQELTIRTFHRGVVRKRLTPVIFSKNNDLSVSDFVINKSEQLRIPTEESTIKYLQNNHGSESTATATTGSGTSEKKANSRSRLPGKVSSSVYNVGLAVMRLDIAAQYQNQFLSKSIKKTSDENSLPPLYLENIDGENIYLMPVFPQWWF